MRSLTRRLLESANGEGWGSLLILHGVFVLTGVGVTLLGSLLPVLAQRWAIPDAHSGAFFAAQFSGCSLGSLFAIGRFRRTLMIGLSLTGLAAILLPIAGALSALGLFFAFGLGLGLTMTSIALLVGQRFEKHRGAALTLLNFSWGVGAVVGPLVVARVLSAHTLIWQGYPLVFRMMAIGCALFLIAVFVGIPEPHDVPRGEKKSGRQSLGLVAFFAAMGFLYVGVETTMGGWISIYSSRMAGVNLARAAAMGSFFWMALLTGRALGSVALLRIAERRLYPMALAMAFIGIGVTASAHTLTWVAVGACISGVALGPIFPMNLSLYLERAGAFSMAGLVLALCGFGGSLLPWLTGVVSSRSGALRSGFWVPAGASLLMLAMLAGLRIWDGRVRNIR
ncbi:MFS transporter [Acidicapsa ligni]|uniref:MFS transporter n=1 Tax=Acidicapsa ligni TaxID=542300 RepID=UPI0021DF63CD|nr:MFS transporter [Acidicapsa ligni]